MNNDFEFELLDAFEQPETSVPTICSHTYISKQGRILCSLCGAIAQDTIVKTKWDSTYTKFSRNLNNEKNIYNDIQGYGLSDQVVMLANCIYQQCCNGVVRGKTRKGIICTCIYYASNLCDGCYQRIVYDNDDTPCECATSCRPGALCFDEVVRIFKIDKRVALKGFKYVNSINNFAFTSFIATPETYISFFLKKLMIEEEQIGHVLDIYKKMVKTQLSNEPRPQSIAAAFIYHWLLQNNKDKIKLENLSTVTEVSQLTIEKLEKEMRAPVAKTKSENSE